MTSTAKNTLVVVVVVIVIIALFFVFRDKMDQSSMVGSENATSTVATSTGGTATGGKGSVASVNTSATIATVNNDQLLSTLIDSAAIRVPNTAVDVAFTKGTASFTEGNVKGTVTRGPILGKVATDDGYDVYTTMTVSKSNSSSTMQYIALFKALNSTVSYTSSVVVGDRLTIQSVAAIADPANPMTAPQQYFNSNTSYILNVSYLDRKNGEAITATPTQQKVLAARVKAHLISR